MGSSDFLVFNNIQEWIAFRHAKKINNLGFVPTMGALHDGHLSLVNRSILENEKTVVSIFINPTQFDRPDDFEKYPNHIEADLGQLKKLNVDYVLLPTASEIYPDRYTMRVQELEWSNHLCGAFRPGHFSGMLTVVLKLLQIAMPTRCYFGLKDYQQFRLIKKLIDSFFIPTHIIGCETVRDPSGLALSSRNERLSQEQLLRAPLLYQQLKESIQNSTSTAAVKTILQGLGFKVEYVEDWEGRRLVAAWLGEVRLIDNVAI